MRSLMRATAAAVLCLFASLTVAHADGWRDSTVYRGLGWTGANTELRRNEAGTRAPAPRRASNARQNRVASSEDRQPRRTRQARANRSGVGRGSVGGGGGTTGLASFYWQPQRVASGGWFNPNAMTAAHKTLPFGTRVRVTHAGNGRSVEVTINDRGPFIAGRIIDLSRAAASAINMTGQGVAAVRMTVLGR